MEFAVLIVCASRKAFRVLGAVVVNGHVAVSFGLFDLEFITTEFRCDRSIATPAVSIKVSYLASTVVAKAQANSDLSHELLNFLVGKQIDIPPVGLPAPLKVFGLRGKFEMFLRRRNWRDDWLATFRFRLSLWIGGFFWLWLLDANGQLRRAKLRLVQVPLQGSLPLLFITARCVRKADLALAISEAEKRAAEITGAQEQRGNEAQHRGKNHPKRRPNIT